MVNLLQVTAEYRARAWGGKRLGPAAGGGGPVGEAWLVYEHNRVPGGPYAGRTLAEVTATEPEALLGPAVAAAAGGRFPLLLKLLDCADWLSVQVHPTDAQAAQLAGPGHLGKTEAWHILEAAPGARLIAGVQPGADPAALPAAIRNGTVLDFVQYHPVHAGDTVYIPAGTLHALGPGLFLYEIQQTSDITYRIYDWNRPASQGRALHLEESVIAVNPALAGEAHPAPRLAEDDLQRVLATPFFALDVITAARAERVANTEGAAFHALTVIEGAAEVHSGGEAVTLNRYASVIVAAGAGAYTIQPLGACRLLRGLPGGV
ncbi:MAG: class I mannose-6-phosphate isomerase [Anaerolineales bacterium]|nr:class I mannose-6-phosphate isomerase [Anaerolineales bacterium]